MIKLNKLDGGTIEITQQESNKEINVDVLDAMGNVNYFYTIPADELIKLLNQYQNENNIWLKISKNKGVFYNDYEKRNYKKII